MGRAPQVVAELRLLFGGAVEEGEVEDGDAGHVLVLSRVPGWCADGAAAPASVNVGCVPSDSTDVSMRMVRS
ncbi:hypothetical protein GCM10010932_05400 [Agromyces flavus]|nr:hypothetical protein GCM10010932_05400 [Agromyces flavus]